MPYRDLPIIEAEAAEQAREDAHGQEEAGPTGDPARPVRRQTAAGNDDVDMRMMGQRRAPGVEDGGEADARSSVLYDQDAVLSARYGVPPPFDKAG
jgi:hypothetical protein